MLLNRKLLVRLGFVFALTAVSLLGQSGVSQITGAVRDAGGAVVPGARVTVVQTATGLSRNVETGSDGSFIIPTLPVGAYRLTIAKDGFTTFVQTGIVLQVDSNPVIDATLTLGSVTQEIQVQADAGMVETHSSGVGQVVDQQRVVELPLNGRNATQLIFVAGAATTAEAGLNSNKNYPTVTISVAGGLSSSITYLLDGANHNDPFNNLNQPIPFPDALQEFKVETSALPAQYGYHAAAAVNAVTKSGTNDFHGDAFEFLRNGDRTPGILRRFTGYLKRNQFGGISADRSGRTSCSSSWAIKARFSASDPTNGTAFVPTPTMLTGDFTAITSPTCNNGRQITLNAPFVNNTISPSRLARPLSTSSNVCQRPINQCGLVRFGTVSNSEEHLGLGRVDYQLSDKHTLFARTISPTWNRFDVQQQ